MVRRVRWTREHEHQSLSAVILATAETVDRYLWQTQTSNPVPPGGFFHTHLLYKQPAYTNRKNNHNGSIFYKHFLFLTKCRGIVFFFPFIFFSCFLNAYASNVQCISRNDKWAGLKKNNKEKQVWVGFWLNKDSRPSQSFHRRSVTCLRPARTRCRLTRWCFMGWVGWETGQFELHFLLPFSG